MSQARKIWCLIQNMTGITALLFREQSPLSDRQMHKWHQSLTKAVGSTLATLPQVAHVNVTTACRLGWFIYRRMQECHAVRRPQPWRWRETNAAQAWGDATVVEGWSSRIPRVRVPQWARRQYNWLRKPRSEMTQGHLWSDQQDGTMSHDRGRHGKPTRWPSPKRPHNVCQVFLDHVQTGPIPNMYCRLHLNNKCVKNCFLSALHVSLHLEEVTTLDWAMPLKHATPVDNSKTRKLWTCLVSNYFCRISLLMSRTIPCRGPRPFP